MRSRKLSVLVIVPLLALSGCASSDALSPEIDCELVESDNFDPKGEVPEVGLYGERITRCIEVPGPDGKMIRKESWEHLWYRATPEYRTRRTLETLPDPSDDRTLSEPERWDFAIETAERAPDIAQELCAIAELSPEGYVGTVDGLETLKDLAQAGIAGGLTPGRVQHVLYSVAVGYCPAAIAPMAFSGFFGRISDAGYVPETAMLKLCGAGELARDRRFTVSPIYDLCAVLSAAPEAATSSRS